MDEKLLDKVCFMLMSALGFIDLVMPSAYKELFSDAFTKEEKDLITEMSRKSDSFAEGMEAFKTLIKE